MCVKTIDLIDTLDFEPDEWNLEGAAISDEGVSISLSHRTHVVEPKPGDKIRYGIRITNSETGGRFAKATLYTLRLVCTNGTVIPDVLGTVWWSTDKRMHYSTKLKAFRNKVATLAGHGFPAITSLYKETTTRRLSERDVVRLFRRMQYVVHSTDQVDEILGVDSDDRARIQSIVRDLEPGDSGDLTRWLVYDIHNRITASARLIAPSRRTTRFTLRERLEEIGGDVLQFSLN